MTTLAAIASLIILGYSAFYVIMCAQFPFGHCCRCEGGGKLYSPFSRKVFRLCPRCEGTGRRVRIGRRVYEYLRGEYKAGNR
ncbi:hypothetical protein [Actinoplanes sp. NPDC049681]|uniref:hypothetical protein n=1 Tax=Actinoplanes sp. NPDC049681 TaxID=3363905 RepID=UPI00378A4952